MNKSEERWRDLIEKYKPDFNLQLELIDKFIGKYILENESTDLTEHQKDYFRGVKDMGDYSSEDLCVIMDRLEDVSERKNILINLSEEDWKYIEDTAARDGFERGLLTRRGETAEAFHKTFLS